MPPFFIEQQRGLERILQVILLVQRFIVLSTEKCVFIDENIRPWKTEVELTLVSDWLILPEPLFSNTDHSTWSLPLILERRCKKVSDLFVS